MPGDPKECRKHAMRCAELAQTAVPSGMWLEFGDAVSERMKVSPQAARSIGWAMGGVGSVCQPSTLRMLI